MTGAVGPTAIIGDVHGDAKALEHALSDLERLGRDLVLVGDYINRGPDSSAVLEILQDLSKAEPRLTLLRGNHEDVLLRFLNGRGGDSFLHHGGLTTVRSYLGTSILIDDPLEQFRIEFPRSHRELLEATQTHYETQDVLVSHAGLNVHRPASRSYTDMVMGSFPEMFQSNLAPFKELVVCGHYVQRFGEPFINPNLICIDTGCGTAAGAPLSALLLPEREIRTYRSQCG